MLRGTEWVTVVRGPYTDRTVNIFMFVYEEVVVNGDKEDRLPYFNVAVYGICKTNICAGASMAEVSDNIQNVGIGANQIQRKVRM